MIKKGYYRFLWNFQSIISLRAPKFVLNKSMGASDDEQGINQTAAWLKTLYLEFMYELQVFW